MQYFVQNLPSSFFLPLFLLTSYTDNKFLAALRNFLSWQPLCSVPAILWSNLSVNFPFHLCQKNLIIIFFSLFYFVHPKPFEFVFIFSCFYVSFVFWCLFYDWKVYWFSTFQFVKMISTNFITSYAFIRISPLAQWQ